MVDYGGQIAMSEGYLLIGTPKENAVLIVADHASNHVPGHIDLGLNQCDLTKHIAWDIGVAQVANLMCKNEEFSAILGTVSRLVVDLNRHEHEDAVIPVMSDGISVPGNRLGLAQRGSRIDAYYHPYHRTLADILQKYRPALILSLHSFTSELETRPDEKRPWDVGILYNQQERASKIAITCLMNCGMNVGDQLPYSGKALNATMDRHAEGNDIAYFGCEMRQDLVSDPAGQARFADALTETCRKITEILGVEP
jgi:predicted N-formylglutamate amidohydrolase